MFQRIPPVPWTGNSSPFDRSNNRPLRIHLEGELRSESADEAHEPFVVLGQLQLIGAVELSSGARRPPSTDIVVAPQSPTQPEGAWSIEESTAAAGLLLRSRGDFMSCAATPTSSWLFYWALGRSRLPSWWHVFAALVDRGSSSPEFELGQAVLSRTARILEARDQVGMAFYASSSQDNADRMAYHFDYLVLLVSGAFDSLARLANELFGRPVNSVGLTWRVSRRSGAGLARALQATAPKVAVVQAAPRLQEFLELVALLRNMIHEAPLPSVGAPGAFNTHFYLGLPDSIASEVPTRTRALGSDDEWGIARVVRDMVEPYTMAHALVHEALIWLEAFGLALTPHVQSTRPSQEAAGHDQIFSQRTARRMWLLTGLGP